MDKVLILLSFLSEAAGRELAVPDPSLYVDLNSAADGDGSQGSPYSSLNSALAAASAFPSISLYISTTVQIASNTQPCSLAFNLTIIGNGVTLKSQGSFTVLKGFSLTLVDLKLTSDLLSPSPLFRSQGLLAFRSVIGLALSNSPVVIESGEFVVTLSDFKDCGAFVLVSSADATVAISNSAFERINGDLVQLYPPATATTGKVALSGLVMTAISGLIVDYLAAPATGIQVNIDKSLFSASPGGLLGGFVSNSNIYVKDLTMRDINNGFNTNLDNSSLSFDNCSFTQIRSRLFESPLLKGLITVLNSNFTDIPQGPLFLVTGQNPLTAVVNISHCLITRVSNFNNLRSGIIAFSVSVSVVIRDVEVWACKGLTNGLLMMSTGAGLVTNLYYHDSTVTTSAFMTVAFSTLSMENVRLIRVENNGGALTNLRATAGYWYNVSIIDSIDVGAVKNFITLWVGYGQNFYVRNCYFRNPGFSTLSMASTSSGRMYLENVVFADNTVTRMFDVNSDGRFIMQNVTFLRTTATFLLNCFQCPICWNASSIILKDPGPISYMAFLSLSQAILSDTTFVNLASDLFHLISGSVVIRNVTLVNSTTAVVRQAFEGSISVQDLVMERCKGGFVFRANYVTGSFVGLKLRGMDVGQIFDFKGVNVTIANSEFVGSVVEVLGGFATFQDSQITMQGCKLDNMSGRMSTSYGLIYAENSKLTVITSSFSRFNASLIYAHQSTLTLYNSQFTDGGFNNPSVYLGKTYGAVLNDHDSYLVTVTACTFTNLAAQFGGAIAHIREKIDVGMLFYAGNLMKNCSAQYGGALYVTKSSLSITTSNFTANNADYGGAVWINGTIDHSTLQIKDSIFSRNVARLEGGAVQHLSCSFLSKGLEFHNNSALYAPDTAMELSYIAYIHPQTHKPQINAIIEGASGQTLPNSVKLGLFDALDQLIVTDNSSQLILQVAGANQEIEGAVIIYADMGIFETNNLLVIGPSQTIINVSATVASISSPVFGVYLRACVVGEQLEDSKCTVCSNNMYSFDPSVPCTLCPREAVCTEGFKLTLLPGYWRSSVYTDSIYSCIVPELCLGGYESQCMEGHTGPMCNACKEDYFKANQLQCVACKGPVTSTFKSFFTLTVSLVSVVASVRDKHNFQMIHSAIFNYFNTLRILANLNIYWPDSLAYLLTVLGDIGSLGLTAFSDLCLGGMSTIESIYSQVFVSVIYFIGIGVMIGVVTAGLQLVRNHTVKYRKVVNLVLFTCYQMLPMLFMRMSQLLSCYEVDSVQRLIYDTSEECWSPRHRRYALGVALPIMLAAVAIPCGLLAASCGKQQKFHFSVIQMAIYLLFNFSLSLILVLSNALQLPSQVGLVVILSIVTELLLNSTPGYRTESFGLIHQVTQAAATMLAITSAIYGGSNSSTDHQTKFIGLSYVILLWPPLAVVLHLLWIWHLRRKFRTLPEDLPATHNMQDSSFSKQPLVAPPQSPASVVVEQSEITAKNS